jgi:hypothetical protein
MQRQSRGLRRAAAAGIAGGAKQVSGRQRPEVALAPLHLYMQHVLMGPGHRQAAW